MEKTNKESTLKNSVIAGTISGLLTATLFQPLEFLKTKLQQPDFVHLSKSKKISHILSNTLKDQNDKIQLRNITKLWIGLWPSLFRSVPVAGLYVNFGIFKILFYLNIKIYIVFSLAASIHSKI